MVIFLHVLCGVLSALGPILALNLGLGMTASWGMQFTFGVLGAVVYLICLAVSWGIGVESSRRIKFLFVLVAINSMLVFIFILSIKRA